MELFDAYADGASLVFCGKPAHVKGQLRRPLRTGVGGDTPLQEAHGQYRMGKYQMYFPEATAQVHLVYYGRVAQPVIVSNELQIAAEPELVAQV